jgi:ABC-type multidrug transport system fused ATPase/permease subunit
MDKIVVMDKGRVAEFGSPSELLAKKDGIYAKLWHMQSNGFIQE